MQFKKEDENYIYELISKNIKKYRKLKGWTQEKLANEINYSLSFIRGIESNYHQTFSLGAIWRIAIVLGIDFSKLCEDDINTCEPKYIKYKCNNCDYTTEIPTDVIKLLKDANKICTHIENSNITFNCSKCDGSILPYNE